MTVCRPHPWDDGEITRRRTDILHGLVPDTHSLYEDGETLFTPPLTREEVWTLLYRALESYAEARALARDLRAAQQLLRAYTGRRRDGGYQALKHLVKGLSARLKDVEDDAVRRLPHVYQRGDAPRFFQAGEGIATDLIDIPDTVVDEVFPPLL